MPEHDDHPPHEAVPWTLLAKYLAGECDPRERAEVAAWLADDPSNAQLLDEMRAAWAAAGAAAHQPDVEGILRRSKRGRPELRIAPGGRAPVERRSRRLVWAAVAVIAASLVVTVWRAGPELSPWMSQPPRGPQRELTTAARQQLTVRFDDGTRIQLAPGSRLHYADPAATGATPRDVTLDGEAVFDVVHDPAHPFTVRAGALVTRDVGTRFIVRAYGADQPAEVTVAAGSVSVSVRPAPGRRAAPPMLLVADQRVRADAEGVLSRDVNVDTTSALAWTAGRLVFAATPMREVVPELARWYGIDVRLGDSVLAERRLSATFTGEPVASVLMSVAAAVDARAERTAGGHAVVFHSQEARQ